MNIFYINSLSIILLYSCFTTNSEKDFLNDDNKEDYEELIKSNKNINKIGSNNNFLYNLRNKKDQSISTNNQNLTKKRNEDLKYNNLNDDNLFFDDLGNNDYDDSLIYPFKERNNNSKKTKIFINNESPNQNNVIENDDDDILNIDSSLIKFENKIFNSQSNHFQLKQFEKDNYLQSQNNLKNINNNFKELIDFKIRNNKKRLNEVDKRSTEDLEQGKKYLYTLLKNEKISFDEYQKKLFNLYNYKLNNYISHSNKLREDIKNETQAYQETIDFIQKKNLKQNLEMIKNNHEISVDEAKSKQQIIQYAANAKFESDMCDLKLNIIKQKEQERQKFQKQKFKTMKNEFQLVNCKKQKIKIFKIYTGDKILNKNILVHYKVKLESENNIEINLKVLSQSNQIKKINTEIQFYDKNNTMLHQWFNNNIRLSNEEHKSIVDKFKLNNNILEKINSINFILNNKTD